MLFRSFYAATNALRLNLIRVYNIVNFGDGIFAARGSAAKEFFRKGKVIKMIIKVNGMMCGHCEAHVQKVLVAIDGIESATASHTDKLVTLTTSGEVEESVVKAAIEAAGYEYAGIVE